MPRPAINKISIIQPSEFDVIPCNGDLFGALANVLPQETVCLHNVGSDDAPFVGEGISIATGEAPIKSISYIYQLPLPAFCTAPRRRIVHAALAREGLRLTLPADTE